MNLRHGIIILRHGIIILRHGIIILRHGIIILRRRFKFMCSFTILYVMVLQQKYGTITIKGNYKFGGKEKKVYLCSKLFDTTKANVDNSNTAPTLETF